MGMLDFGDRLPEMSEVHIEGITQQIIKNLEARQGLDEAPEVVAHTRWQAMIARLAESFFPTRDFLNPHFSCHPATRFVLACINNDPRTLENLEHYFSTVDVGLSVFAFRHPSVPDEAGPDGMLLWIPLYPGVTANDLKSAAPDLVRAANDTYADRLPIARIRTLRDSRMTQQEIANRLGLTIQTVSAALKTSTRKTPDSD